MRQDTFESIIPAFKKSYHSTFERHLRHLVVLGPSTIIERAKIRMESIERHECGLKWTFAYLCSLLTEGDEANWESSSLECLRRRQVSEYADETWLTGIFDGLNMSGVMEDLKMEHKRRKRVAKRFGLECEEQGIGYSALKMENDLIRQIERLEKAADLARAKEVKTTTASGGLE